jgi:hypothetical protein
MTSLMRRDNIVFRDQTVYMAGHAFVNCTFEHCTIVVRESTGVLDNCTFNHCVWHLDLFIGDRERFQALVSNIGPILLNSLPTAAGAPMVNANR